MQRRHFLPLLCGSLAAAAEKAAPVRYDVVVYGGTAGGLAAAMSAAKEGASVLVLEPSNHVGGMVTGGLGRTDIGIGESIGGMAAEFYRRVKLHYDKPESWKLATQNREDYLAQQPRCVLEDKWWFHEPSVASAIFSQMLSEQRVQVLRGRPLKRLRKQGARIQAITLSDESEVEGRVFIDATYEGDLLALAGVHYRVGRESTQEYGEKFAGVLPREICTRKQWDVDVSPFGDDGKLLFGVQDTPRGEDGAGDKKVQAYNYRICLTDAPENVVPIEPPEGYNPRWYDLLARYMAVRGDLPLIKPSKGWGVLNVGRLPNRKTDINDGGPFSTDCIGMNWNYPDGTDEQRRTILQRHLDFTKGLLYFCAQDSRVPAAVRKEMLRWGYPRDEFSASGHFTPQLYVREARRMVGDYVMTSHDIELNRTKTDSIGLGSYGADSHLVQRIADGKFVRNEGNPNDFTPGHRVYEIPYRAITPKQAECDNLLVTFCVSASHMAFASVRMEPVFMILSESAGIAAHLAAKEDLPVQQTPYARILPKLRQRRQILSIEDVES
ncbi:MAG: FAD-dependent oxidoreductase [Bryobacterales bacterium]